MILEKFMETESEIIKISRETCVYTSCYCEENVWKLCETLEVNFGIDLAQFYVVFISNKNKKIPLWCQTQSRNAMKPVVWDYHVILVQNKGKTSLVYDLDTTLEFPCELQKYAEKALGSEDNFHEMYFRMFRVIPAACYLKGFASDRSHMVAEDGTWLKPPPPYPPLRTQDSTMNLFDFIDMNPEKGQGRVMDLNTFLKHFHCDVGWNT